MVTLHGSGFVALGAPYCAFGNVRTARGATQPPRAWEGDDDAFGDVPREAWGWFPRDPGEVDPSLPVPAHMDDLLHVAALCGPDARACAASPELLMPATILGPNEARCRAPAVAIWPAAPQLLELTLNGDPAAKTADNHTFAIFGQPGFEANYRTCNSMARKPATLWLRTCNPVARKPAVPRRVSLQPYAPRWPSRA